LLRQASVLFLTLDSHPVIARLRPGGLQIRDADGFVFVTGEYNWGVQPGLPEPFFQKIIR
jgi:hypothetical protein